MDVTRGSEVVGRPQEVGGSAGALDLEPERPLVRSPSRPPRAPASAPGRPRSRPLLVGCLALAALVASTLVSRLVFPHFSVNNDEPIYAFQARLLVEGQLTLDGPPTADFFRPWMSGMVGDRLVMVFPPVLPALLAAGQILFGSMRIVLGLLAAAGVLLVHRLAREITGNGTTAALAAVLLAVCPLFVIQSGLFLSYVLGLDLALAVATLLVVAARRARARWFAAAGAVLGVLAFARPLDAVLVGVPLLGAALVVLRRGGGGWRPPIGLAASGPASTEAGGTARAARRPLGTTGALVAVAVGASPPLALMLAYNNAVAGNPFRLPLAAIGGDNSLGFGLRHMAEGTRPVRYDVGKALWATGVNLGALPAWLPGGFLLIGLALVGLHRLRRQPWAWGLAALAVTFPLGYLFYWGNLLVVQGRLAIGPHYYLPVLLPAAVLGAAGLQRLWSARLALGLLALAVLIGSSVHAIDVAVRRNHRQVALHGEERELLAEAGLTNAVVILPSPPPDGPWLGHPRPTFMNDPSLDNPVLFATDRAGRNFELLDRFPGRTFVRQFSRTPSGLARPAPKPTLWRLDPRVSPQFRLQVRVTNTDGQPVLGAYLTDGTRAVSYVIDRHSSRGRSYDLTWTVSPSAISLEGAAEPAWERTLPAPAGAGTLAVGVSSGPSEDRRTAALVETRYWYRVQPGGPLELMLPGEGWRKAAGKDPSGRPSRWLDLDFPYSYSVEVLET